jgi:hypothetical protein
MLWQITGFTATEIAKRLYDRVITTRDGNAEVDGDNVAAAPRAVVISLREGSPGISAMYWAPYIHTGPRDTAKSRSCSLKQL